MASIDTAGGGSSGTVTVTLTVGGPSTSPPTVSHPGTTPPGATPPAATTVQPPRDPLPMTGAPVAAELDLALVVVVAGATVMTAASRLAHRRR